MTKITIIHTNDLHDSRSIFPVIRRLMDGENTVFFDSGDAIGGSNTLFYLREPMYDEMNRAGCRAMAMGNREFNYLRPVLSMRRKSVKFPILAANLRDLTGKASRCWDDYVVTEVAGVRIGVTGLSPVQFPEHSLLTRLTGFRFIPPLQALGEVMEKMKHDHAQLTILLSHLGIADDVEIARNCRLDIILGGHSHTDMEKPLVVGGTSIVHSGSHGMHAGKLDIVFNGGIIESAHYERVPAECPRKEPYGAP